MKFLLDKYFSLIRRFIPDQDQQTMIGLDVGENSCRFVELVNFGDHIELVRWSVIPIQKETIKDAIASVINVKNKKSEPVKTTVFGKGTLIRYIDMPRMSANDFQKSIALEADKYFPFDPDSVYLDFHILDSKSKNTMMSVLVAAVKRDMIDERMSLFGEIGVNCSMLTLKAVANINAFFTLASDSNVDEKDAVYALIDIDETVTNMVIVDSGVPRFTRDIYVGSHDFTRRIANALGVEFREAQKLRESPGERKKEVQQACESIQMNLFAEIRLSLDYFTTEKNIHVKKIFLMGEGSLSSGIDDAFQEQFDIPLELWSALSNIKIADSIASEEITPHALKLNTAIGLALSHD